MGSFPKAFLSTFVTVNILYQCFIYVGSFTFALDSIWSYSFLFEELKVLGYIKDQYTASLCIYFLACWARKDSQEEDKQKSFQKITSHYYSESKAQLQFHRPLPLLPFSASVSQQLTFWKYNMEKNWIWIPFLHWYGTCWRQWQFLFILGKRKWNFIIKCTLQIYHAFFTEKIPMASARDQKKRYSRNSLSALLSSYTLPSKVNHLWNNK